MLPILLVVLATPPADFEAARLTATPDPACARGRLVVQDLRLTVGDARARAAEAAGCLPDALALRGLAVEAPGGRLTAAEGQLTPHRFTATTVEATGCRCADPPWRLTARAVQIEPDGVRAEWPVFWAGPVPLATAPVGYLPLGRRRSGFLPPVVGWDGEDGLYVGLPRFLTLGDAADLTLAPGWRMGRGLAGYTRLRWVTDPVHAGQITLRSVLTEGFSLDAAGSARWGALRAAVAGDATTHVGLRQAQYQGLPARARDHLRLDLGLAAADAVGGLGLRSSLFTDLRRAGALPDQRGVQHVLPEAWLRWRFPFVGGQLGVDSVTTLRSARGRAPHLTTDLGLQATRTTWLGPLRLRPVLGAATQAHLTEHDDAAEQVLVAWAAAEAELAVARRFGATTHRVGLLADARAGTLSADRIADPLVAADQPFAARGLGLTLSNRLLGPGWRARLDLRLAYEGALGSPWVPLQALARLDTPWVGLDGHAVGLDAAWANLRLGAVDGVQLLGGATRFAPDRDLALLRSDPLDRPVRWTTDVEAAHTVEAGLALPLGRVRLDYRAVFGVGDDAGLRGQWGALGFEGRCACWSARLVANHERGRATPDLRLAFSLSGL